MTTIKKIPMFRVFLILLFFVFVSPNAFPVICLNGAGGGYDPGEGDGDGDSTGLSASMSATGNATIESYIVEGAAYYLQGCAGLQALLNRVELQEVQGIDFRELQQLADSALANMSRAVTTYERLIACAKATPYHWETVYHLFWFDYRGFCAENGLNREIFYLAAGYLCRGDITGSFQYFQGHLKTLEGLLIEIHTDIFSNRLPGLDTCWQLNEASARATLFGSYIARVFRALQ
jgi:hypothetical protein